MKSFTERLVEKLARELSISADICSELLEIPPDDKMGDYALPCFPFSKELKRAPALIAEEFSKKVMIDDLVARAEVKGPYLNIFINKETLIKETITAILKEDQSYGATTKKGEKVMIEYSQPNTHKAFHVGHLRGTSIGEALSRILKHGGYEVVQANYSGDTGMHVAKWLWCYRKFHKGEEPPTKKRDLWLANIYVEAVKKLETEPEAQEEVDRINLSLEKGEDKQLLKEWEETRKWSIDEFNAIYKELQAHFDVWWFEREMEGRGKDIVKELLAKGIAEKSDGAVIINLEKYNLGVWVLLRSDGTVLYSAKDLALAEIKFNDYKINRSIYVVGKAQEHHMQQLFKTLELMNFSDAKRCFHLSFEEVRLPDGKMSSRTGNNVLYSEMRDEVFSYAEKEIRTRHEEWSDEQVKRVTSAVALCALKFEMIYRDHNKPIVYDVAKVCDFEGDTGPYIQYTYARCNSLLKKLSYEVVVEETSFDALKSDIELSLAKELQRFPSVIDDVTQNLYPETLAKYLLGLAKVFNSFYHSNKVIGEEKVLEQARATLVKATEIVIGNSLYLLGIDAPKEM